MNINEDQLGSIREETIILQRETCFDIYMKALNRPVAEKSTGATKYLFLEQRLFHTSQPPRGLALPQLYSADWPESQARQARRFACRKSWLPGNNPPFTWLLLRVNLLLIAIIPESIPNFQVESHSFSRCQMLHPTSRQTTILVFNRHRVGRSSQSESQPIRHDALLLNSAGDSMRPTKYNYLH